MTKVLPVALSVYLALVGRAQSSEDIRELPDFFVALVKTEVHRAVVARDVTAYAVVNCSDLVIDGKLEMGQLDEVRLKSELSKLALADPASLRLVLRYTLSPANEVSKATKKTIRTTLENICQSAGFKMVRTTEMSTTAAWSSYSGVWNFKEATETDETIVEDGLIRAYPLRTRLSKLVAGNADCVVEIKRPFDGRQQNLSAELRTSVKQAVQSMGLGQKKGVLKFRVSSTTAGEEVVEKLFDSTPPVEIPPNVGPALRDFFAQRAAQYKPSAGRKMGIELGFESITYSHSPNGGAPEKLVGKPAPNFRLQALDCEDLELHSFLNNRPSLVTFWGVACGPCCLEAPHLTAMHEKHSADFVIVAVNAYNESREVVSRFAEQTKLTHPIVLNGQSVANDLYHVGAYPTTFWINRDGIVEDYEVGFDSATALESRIVAMLAKE